MSLPIGEQYAVCLREILHATDKFQWILTVEITVRQFPHYFFTGIKLHYPWIFVRISDSYKCIAIRKPDYRMGAAAHRRLPDIFTILVILYHFLPSVMRHKIVPIGQAAYIPDERLLTVLDAGRKY